MKRYEPLLKIASGGTASVWVGAAAGDLGFRQLVAIKRPHAHLAEDAAFRAALVEEAKIAARLRHANAVDVRDVEVDESGIQLVMDWVEGGSLSDMIRGWSAEPPARAAAVAVRIVLDACQGLEALHELTTDDGAPLGCVHRDVSPANVLVGLDGVGRITDFGLAKPLLAVERGSSPGSEGALRGKLGYMAPEYIRGRSIDRRVDVFAMGIVLWEALARKRLFRGENDADTLERVQRMTAPSLAFAAPWLGEATPSLDALLARAMAKDPDERIASVAAFAEELEAIARQHDLLASHAEVRDSFPPAMRVELEERRRRVSAALADPAPSPPTPTPRASAFRIVAPLVVVTTFAGIAGIFLLTPDADVPVRPTTARTVAPDVQGRDDAARTRASTAASAAGSPAAPPAIAPKAVTGFAPRPNPYAHGPSAKR